MGEIFHPSPKGKLFQILASVCFSVLILSLLVLLGSSRRRYKNEFLRFLIHGSYYLSFILIAYTMGQMHSAPFNNEFFPLWGMVLLIVYGSADSISSCSLEDTEQWKKHAWEICFQLFLMARLLIGFCYGKKLKYSIIPLVLLNIVIASKAGERLLASQLASKRGLEKMAKPVADWMINEHTSSTEFDPINMKGYKYIVMELSNEDPNEDPITVEKVWECPGLLLSGTGDLASKLKDVCLSFALYKLLCRRFAGYPAVEFSHEKTWRFVRYGLLRDGGGSERPFRVIELELAFLYDIFYTKYTFIFGKLKFRLFSDSLILVLGCYVATVTFMDSCKDSLHIPAGEHKVDAIVTMIVLSVVIFSVITQILLFAFSNWVRIIFLSKYVRKPSLHQSKLYETVVKFACSIPRPKPWSRKLGQYSLLKSFNYKPSLLHNIYFTLTFADDPGRLYKESSPINLSEAVKDSVLAWIKDSDRSLTRGKALRQNRVESNLSWACPEFATHTEVIMIWHIATSLCEIQFPENPRHENDNRHRHVATDLSKYCAYLAAFAPRLLPDHAYVTECKFREIVNKADEHLNGCRTLEAKSNRLRLLAEREPNESSVLVAGARLANQLIQEIRRPETVWKILADFWTKMILVVAPSDDVTAHVEYLARGGEFVTHLWALLFHAGIVNTTRNREQSFVPTPMLAGSRQSVRRTFENLLRRFFTWL